MVAGACGGPYACDTLNAAVQLTYLVRQPEFDAVLGNPGVLFLLSQAVALPELGSAHLSALPDPQPDPWSR